MLCLIQGANGLGCVLGLGGTDRGKDCRRILRLPGDKGEGAGRDHIGELERADMPGVRGDEKLRERCFRVTGSRHVTT
jgi:hypothetical protein